MGLLRNEAVRDWLQVSSSSLIWVNTHRRAGPADWATAFATRTIEYASKIDNMMVLYHLCGNHPTSDQVSTSTVVLQSIIMQVIQQHCKKFVRKVFPFTLEHFQDVRDDMEDLWELFSSCCDESRAPCVWLIIDNINNLQKGEDYDNLLLGLQNLVDTSSRVVKIFISARANEAPEALLKAAIAEPEQEQGRQSSRRVAVVNVPRAQSSISAALLSKQKRLARIPDPSPNCESPSAKADIAGLLDSSEDDLISDRKEEEEGFSVVTQSPGSITSTMARAKAKSDDFSDLSDSSMEFTRVDPFATSEESDLGEAERRRQQHQQSSEDDIDNEEDVFFPSSRAHHHENPLLSSSDDDVHLAIPGYSKRKPRGRSDASRRPTRKQHSPLDMSASDGDESG